MVRGGRAVGLGSAPLTGVPGRWEHSTEYAERGRALALHHGDDEAALRFKMCLDAAQQVCATTEPKG